MRQVVYGNNNNKKKLHLKINENILLTFERKKKHCSSVVNFSHFNQLLWSHRANLNQTLVEWSLDGPLPKMCPVIPTFNQDGRQAKNRKIVTKYQISAINSCWEKCAYMFNVYKKQLRRQTGSRNLTGTKTLPTIWYTYMTLVCR
jgi:hypothetical protein